MSGTETDDLSKLVASIGKVTAALNVHEQDLSELFRNFDAFFHNFAMQSPSLSATVAILPSSLRNIDRGFAALDAAVPADAGVRARPDPRASSTALDDHRRAALDRTGAGLARRQASSAASPRACVAATPAFAKLFGEQPAFFNQIERSTSA